MWKRLEIDGGTCFLRCATASSDMMQCVLYDFTESWSAALTAEELINVSKQLNKRIHYEEASVRETLRLAEPEVAIWLPSDDDTSQKTLKLRYRVEGLPLHFEWSLQKQTADEFRSSFILPLFKTIHGMIQQVTELRETVTKKDVELLQYRKEGLILSRTTVQTKPFDFVQFDENFAELNTLSKSFQMIGQHLEPQFAAVQVDAELITTHNANRAVKTDETTSNADGPLYTKKPPKLSPRDRKRKIQKFKQEHIQRKLESRKQRLVFANSQSDIDDSQKLSIDSPVLAGQMQSTKEEASMKKELLTKEEPPTKQELLTKEEPPMKKELLTKEDLPTKDDPPTSSGSRVVVAVQRAVTGNDSSPAVSTCSAVASAEVEMGRTTRSGQIPKKRAEPKVSPPKRPRTLKGDSELNASVEKKHKELVVDTTLEEDEIGKQLEAIQNLFRSLEQKNQNLTPA